MLLGRGCPGCGGALTGPHRKRRRAICRLCLDRARPAGEIHSVAGLDRCGALFQYRGRIQRALLAGKYGARRDGLSHFGVLLGDLARDLGFEVDAVTWVPASSRGRRQRGYDQGRVLAGALGLRVGVPAVRLLAPARRSGPVGWAGQRSRAGRRGSVGRTGHLGQTGRGREERLSSPSPRVIRRVPCRVLVVDDVITTGASISAAATVLRAAGAAAVVGLAVAWTASDYEVLVGRPLTVAMQRPGAIPGPSRAEDRPRQHGFGRSRSREEVVGDLWGSADRWG